MTEEAQLKLKQQQELADKMARDNEEADRLRDKKVYGFLEEKQNARSAIDRLNNMSVAGRYSKDREKRWDFEHNRATHRQLAATPGLPEIKKEFIKESINTDEAVKKTL